MRGRTIRWLAFTGLMLLFGVNVWHLIAHYDLPFYVNCSIVIMFAIVAGLMLYDLLRPSSTALTRRRGPSGSAGR